MRENDPIAVLMLYGLDQMLTDQDDPLLWAAILSKHWPKPGELASEALSAGSFPSLFFGVGGLPDRKSAPFLKSIAGWTLEKADNEHLRACQERLEFYDYILEVSRPSVGVETVLVHNGSLPAPLIGHGEIKIWLRQENGDWTETEKVITSWFS